MVNDPYNDWYEAVRAVRPNDHVGHYPPPAAWSRSLSHVTFLPDAARFNGDLRIRMHVQENDQREQRTYPDVMAINIKFTQISRIFIRQPTVDE